MEYLFIYLLQITDSISGLLEILGFIAIFFLVLLIAMFYMREAIYASPYATEKEKHCIDNAREITKKICIPSITAFIILAVIPTKQTLLLMGGTYLGKKAVNAVVTDEKIKKIDTIINLQLDKYIEELKGREVKQL